MQSRNVAAAMVAGLVVVAGAGAPAQAVAPATSGLLAAAIQQAVRPGPPERMWQPIAAPGVELGQDGRIAVIVLLREPSTSEVYAEALGSMGPGRAPAIAALTRSHAQRLRLQQQDVLDQARARGLAFGEIYRLQKALNAVALRIAPGDLGTLKQVPGVARVELLESHELHHANSVPFIGAPEVWENALGLAAAAAGEGVSIGIIDTGVDYLHATFGGTGSLPDYVANNPAVVESGSFPTARVVGGIDLAGDAYTGSNTPVPDDDPMDCHGHGTHVAGTAAGGGVNADGSAFTGPYASSTPFGSLRVGPGVAPRADLYAIRVFGCGGTTQLTNLGIEWAMDPDGDSDLSDHLDVINMSLGSSFGTAFSSSALAADNAAAAGVVVVASAGNSGDTFFVSGSPGSGGRVVSVANIADTGVAGTRLLVNSPPAISGGYPAAAAAFTDPTPPGPPAPAGQTGDVVLAVDATGAANDACQVLTNAAAVAGNVVLADRGNCNFSIKLDNANAAGAAGLIVANNSADPVLFSMTGAAVAEVSLPSLFVSQATGDLIKAQLGTGVEVTFDGSVTSADIPSVSTSRGPRGASRNGGIVLKPDVAAPGSLITSAQTGRTCDGTVLTGCIVPSGTGFIADSQPLTISGTSMAAPHIAGLAALLRQLHPDWSVDQVTGALSNGGVRDVTFGAAGSGDLHGSSRIGSGRTDAGVTAGNNVTVGSVEDPGRAALSFDLEPVVDSTSDRSLQVTNHDPVAHTFALSIRSLVDAPGVGFSLPSGSMVEVPAQSTVEIPVRIAFDPEAMDSRRDPTVSTVQTGGAGSQPRHFLTEESAVLEFRDGGELRMRVPLYAAVRPYGDMSATDVLATGSPAVDSTVSLALSGTGLCTGTLSAGPNCTGTFPADRVGLASLYELAATSPRVPDELDAHHDLRYAGVAYDAATNTIQFGLATWGEWNTLASDVSFSVYIDNDEDGDSEFVVFTSNNGTLGGAPGNDVFLVGLLNVDTSGLAVLGFVNQFSAATLDSALYNTNVLNLAFAPADVGLGATNSDFRWKAETCFGAFFACEQQFGGFFLDEVGTTTPAGVPVLSFDYLAPALDFNAPFGLPDLDLDGIAFSTDFVAANATANGTLGALVLHHHNEDGNRAEVVALQAGGLADLDLAGSTTDATLAVGDTTSVTFTVTNDGSDGAAGVAAAVDLPLAVAHAGHAGDGSFDPSSGAWTIGALDAGASASLVLTLQAQAAGLAPVVAEVGSDGIPLDPVASNNTAVVPLSVSATADLSVDVSAAVSSVEDGSDVVFTLTLGNAGPEQALNVGVGELFLTPGAEPAAPHAFTASTGSYNPSTGIWSIGALSATSELAPSLSLTFTTPRVAAPLSLEATVSSSTADGSQANNVDSASVDVVLRPDAIFSDGLEDPVP